MSKDFYEGERVAVTSFAGGTSAGFAKPTPAIQITQLNDPLFHGYVVMSAEEAEKMARAILRHLGKPQPRRVR